MKIKLFSGHWCPECAAREELFIQLCSKYDIDLEILQVEEGNARREAASYRVNKIPMALIIDEDEPEGSNVMVQFGPHARKEAIHKWLEDRMTFNAESDGGDPETPGEEDVPRQ